MKLLQKAFLRVWLLNLFVLRTVQIESANGFINLKNKDAISKAMVYLIHSCYNKNDSLVISGDWDNDDIFEINKIFIPIYSVGLHEDVHFVRHQRLKNVFKMSTTVIRKKKYPGLNFIIMVSSINTMQLALEMLKKSILWNHEGYFLIICKDGKKGCENAQPILHLIWAFHILSTTLLCYDDNEIIQMYTFNPYARLAPTSWQAVESKDDNADSWTLYRQQLNESVVKSSNLDSVFCNDLRFDKTQKLNGYTIKMGAHINSRLLPYNNREIGLRRFGGVNGEICNAIWTFLNANATMRFYSKAGYVDVNNSLRSFLKDLVKGEIEFAMNMNLLRDFWRLQSYPHESVGFCMVTRKNSLPSTESFEFIFSLNSILFLVGISISLVAVLKYLIKRTACYALLELLRMIVTSPTVSVLPNSARKVYFVHFTLAMMLLSTFFQSRLTSYDVVPSSNPTIDTDDDMVNTNLMIYGTLEYNEFIPDLDVSDRFQTGNQAECVTRLLAGEYLICVSGCYEARFNAYEGKQLHISHEIRRFYMTFSTAEDWPLYTRFNVILSRLSETGLIALFRRREAYKFIHNTDDRGMDQQGLFRRNMKMSWYIWFIGLSLASLTFIVEYCIYNIKNGLISC